MLTYGVSFFIRWTYDKAFGIVFHSETNLQERKAFTGIRLMPGV